MKSFYSLVSEYNSLPSGNVYLKFINDKTYTYYQWSENGKKKTKYISFAECKDLEVKIKRREELSVEIKKQLKLNNRNIVLSNAARSYTGYLMMGDKVVAEFNNGELISYKENLLPLIVKRTHSLLAFLKTRVIDTSRTNARLLKKAMNIHEETDELLSLCSYAASLTDNYWFKPKKSKLKYKDVSFDSDIYFDVALKGIMSFYPRKISPSPELTTGGSYEKGWRKIGEEWWLYKAGTDNEKFSEMFYSTLFEELGLPTAHYELDGEYIKTKNFVKDVNYEPMVSIMGDDESYEHVLNKLLTLDKNIAMQYMVLIYYDVLLNNIDRHNENYGLIRDRKTGEILSLAPNFDDNLCLISRSTKLDSSNKEGLLSYFIKFLKSNLNAKQLLKEANLDIIDDSLLDRCFKRISIKVDEESIKTFILSRYKYINDELFK